MPKARYAATKRQLATTGTHGPGAASQLSSRTAHCHLVTPELLVYPATGSCSIVASPLRCLPMFHCHRR